MTSLRRTRRSLYAFIFGLFDSCIALAPRSAFAWGDEGHEIIALVAERFLDPAVREKITAMLAADPDNLTAHDTTSEATWAVGIRTPTDADRASITSKPTSGISWTSSLVTRTSTELALGIRHYQPEQSRRMARPELA